MITEATIHRGVNRLARELGCSKGHLSQVLLRKRACSPSLAARLRRMGFDTSQMVVATPPGRHKPNPATFGGKKIQPGA